MLSKSSMPVAHRPARAFRAQNDVPDRIVLCVVGTGSVEKAGCNGAYNQQNTASYKTNQPRQEALSQGRHCL